MSTVILPKELHNAILNISFQLDKQNELLGELVELKKAELEHEKGIII